MRSAPLVTVPLLAAAAALASAQNAPPGPTLPLEVVVPAKADLPPRNFTETIPGSKVTFEMVYVPGGEFAMGSPDDEPGRRADEGPQRWVAVKPFWLAKCEVTWNEFELWYQARDLFAPHDVPPVLHPRLTADAITKPSAPFVDENYEHGRDRHPAICMTHHAAMMYCHWLRYKTKKGYRLPTEAEWEYACRAGSPGAYGIPAGASLGDYAWFRDNSATADHTSDSPRGKEKQPTTHRVGTKRANAFGLHDLHGNVWEWCLDHYDAKALAKLPADRVTVGPVTKLTDRKWGHAVRGGSWADTADRLRSAARRASDRTWMKHDPEIPQSIWWLTKMDVIGFRVALPAEEYPELVDVKPMVLKRYDRPEDG